MTTPGERPGQVSRSGRARVTVLAVIAVLFVGTLFSVPRGSAPPDWTFPPATAGGTPTGTAVPSTAPSDAEWADLDVPPFEPSADLVPDNADAAGVALDTAFTLHSRTATPAAELAAALETDPPIALAVEPAADPATARFRPTERLTPGATYRFRLRAPGGALAASWVFQAKQPLRVVNTLPGNESSGVPIDTGIEVTFDQDGVTGAAEHFLIEPAVSGRFEQHGRTLAFVPLEELAHGTVYRVAVRRGVGINSSDQVLETDLTFSFETAAEAPAPVRFWVEIGRPIIESPPDERPVIGVWAYGEEGAVPKTLALEVYRLPSLGAAVSAARTILTAPGWATWSSVGLVPTDGLRRVLRFDGRLESIDTANDHVIRFPARLDPGWYLVVLPLEARDRQALLQVSEVAVYAMATETRTLAWVSDIATGRPLPGAAIAVADRPSLGVTDADGLLLAPTPAEFRQVEWEDLTASPRILTAAAPDGRAALAALGVSASPMYGSETLGISRTDEPNERFWLIFATDRTQYRRSDTLNAWGVVRERVSGRVPDDLELRLVTEANAWSGSRAPAIATARAEPDARGVFAASLPFTDLPLGGYRIELWNGGRQLSNAYVSVADIRKPAFGIEVSTDRRVYVEGEPMTVTGSVAFFDGTRAPGAELAFDGSGSTRATSGPDGVATGTLTARNDGQTEGWGHVWLSAAPARPEEGEISGGAVVAVFPGDWWIDASGTIAEGRLRVTGTLSELDRERLEREFTDTGDLEDPAGTPVRSGRLTATVTELIPVRTVIGRTYDFIAKRSVPIYSYDVREKSLGTETLTTSVGGAFGFELPVATTDHDFRVVLTAHDGRGREIRRTLEVSAPGPLPPSGTVRPYLEAFPGCFSVTKRYRLGEPMSLTFRDAGGPLPSGPDDRYLFVVARQGLRDATVQRSSRFERAFTEADLPNLNVHAVWFTGRGYVPAHAPVTAALQVTDKALGVTVTPDRERYLPGEQVTLTLRTTDRGGRPTPASVVLRAVDEKLFATGGAADVDPLQELYRFVGSGVLGTYASHQVPMAYGGDGCGDASGGREDFRDWLLFRKVVTGADGLASVTFKLSDDLTSWHVSASAVSARYEAGSTAVLVPVGLPFFVEAVLAPEYLVTDQAVLRLRAFGSDLRRRDPVRFTVEAPSLGLAPAIVDGTAFEAVRVPLPPLSPGEHRITIGGESGAGPGLLSDRLTRQIAVITSRLARTETRIAPLTPGWRPEGGPGLTTVSVSDAGRGRFLPILGSLAGGDGARLDQALAAAVARDLLIEEFGQPAWSLPPPSFERSRYQDYRGISLLPYAGPDLALTVRASLVAPDRFDPYLLREALRLWVDTPDLTRERRVIALAALAALGDPVLLDTRRLAAEPDLTVRERLYLALAYAEAGDDASALAIERELLGAYGQRLGPWVRLDVGASLDDTLEATSLLALLAAGLGDPIAADAEAYVEANPGHDDLFVLQQLGYVRRSLERADPAAGRFAATVAGERSVVELGPGEGWSLTLTADQLATLRLEPLAGELAVATSWQASFNPASATPDPDVSIERSVAPAGDLPEDRVARVTLTVRFGPKTPAGCYEVTDRLPSGLAPIARTARWPEGEPDAASDAIYPYLVEGQRVAWCIAPDSKRRDFRLAYTARVVSPGTYRWEPATIQSTIGAERLTATPPLTITIR
jgi:hypothetical protein